MMNIERLFKHAVQEKLAITICIIKKVSVYEGVHGLTKEPSLWVHRFVVYDKLLCRLIFELKLPPLNALDEINYLLVNVS